MMMMMMMMMVMVMVMVFDDNVYGVNASRVGGLTEEL